MTPRELTLPWRAFAIDGLAPWTAVVAGPGGEMELRAWSERVRTDRGSVEVERHELLDICAAAELGRLDASTLVRAYQHARAAGRWIPWRWLLAGADGLRRDNAPGELSAAAALERLGLRLVRVEMAETPHRAERHGRAA